MRDTWLQDVPLGVDYKFFFGNHNFPSPEEWRSAPIEFKTKRTHNPDMSSHILKTDEIVLNTSDRYENNVHKFQHICRWAHGEGYDFMFQCLTDTYVVPKRLLNSGFEQHDYCGTSNGERTALGGGPGFWLSRQALEMLMFADIRAWQWTYDAWVGEVLLKRGLALHHDSRYTNYDQPTPQNTNDVITSHIANTPEIYDPAMMIGLHRLYKGTL